MENNFMDDEDSEELFDEGDLMELDDADMYAEVYNMSSEDSNMAGETSDGGADGAAADSSNTEPISFQLSPDKKKLLDQFSIDEFYKELNAKSGTGDLLALLQNHWRQYAPLCFSVLENPRRNLVELDSDRVLIKPLEAFLCNDLDTEAVLGSLAKLDDPPQLCGKVFKNGEPSYFCRDCGSDPTCVLCSYCFRRSKHREHRYKMMTSGGGGYCDCGDPEAWKSHPYCDLHLPKSSTSEDDTSSETHINKLPTDLTQRASFLFTHLLDYMFEVLSVENSEHLPGNLKPLEEEDDYVTMLYNDEVHSYDQVTSTLRKVLGVDERGAFEYATIVDKEGRSALKRGKKEDCVDMKRKVETTMASMGGQMATPLETRILHHSLVAHQYFAEKLISWLQKICSSSKGLKHLFCKIGLFAKPESHSIIEKLMLSDNLFWKSSRALLHQFYISTYFMDPVWKKEFSVVYIKNYKLIWKNHIKNHDDTISLTDLTVQIFTVTSLSKYLISNFNLLQTIMETLIEHCKTSKGKLSFPRGRFSRNNPEFRRAQQMLFDMKYCLTSYPDDWTDELRMSFINGFKSFVEFIKFMHGMDGIERYAQQHVEYEPEWETSFNLSIKLQKSISSLLEWCASDKAVYVECYKYMLNAVNQLEMSSDSMFTYKYDKIKLDGHSYEIIDFNMLKEEVSIHAPLTRLYAAMYPIMGKFGLGFNSIQEHIHGNSSNAISSLKHDPAPVRMHGLIEPSLRALVLATQSNAGLWKRNGFSLVSQVYFYTNIKCRQEMFDRDLLSLQVGASVIEPNEYLVNMMHRFGLYDFLTNENFEPSTSTEAHHDLFKLDYLIPLTEEFLEILIYIISERYDPLMSQIQPSNKLEREVIHQLCISPMPHSDLVKNIFPDNEKYTNELESVLARLATKKNSGSQTNSKVIYELKEEYLPYYSPYFYHYAKSDKTKSEEYQIGLRKADNLDKFFKPPRLPQLTELFAKIAHLLDSDVFVRIVMCILRRFTQKSKLTSEGQFVRLMHLIGLALYEEQNDLDKNFESDQTAYEFSFLEKSIASGKKSLFSLKVFKTDETLIKLLTQASEQAGTESFKHYVEWILNYSQRLLKLKNKIDEQKQQAVVQTDETVSVEASTSAAVASENAQKEKRKNLIAEKRRSKIMAQINKQSASFLNLNKEYFDSDSSNKASSDSSFNNLVVLSEEEEKLESSAQKLVCIGPAQTRGPVLAQKKSYQCILCKDETEIAIGNPTMVLCCYVQSSRVLSKVKSERIEDFDKFDPLFVKNTLTWGINTTSCGHVMHANCWQKVIDTIRQAENRRQARFLGFNIKRNEYMCPLCETIGNSVLPIFPQLHEFSKLAKSEEPKPEFQIEESKLDDQEPKSEIKSPQSVLSYDDWLNCLEKTMENSIQKEHQDDKDVITINPCPLSTITKLVTDAVAQNFHSLFVDLDVSGLLTSIAGSAGLIPSTSTTDKILPETIDYIENYTRASYTFGFNTLPHDDDYRMPVSLWANCAYTIQVLDQLLIYESKPLFGQLSFKQADLLANIVKQAALYGLVKNQASVRKLCLRLWSSLLPKQDAAHLESKNVVELDMFHLLVSLVLSMPNLYDDKPRLSSVPHGGLNCFNILKITLQAHTLQIFLSKIKSYQTNHGANVFLGPLTSGEMNVDAAPEEASTGLASLQAKVHEFFHFVLTASSERNILKLSSQEKARLSKLSAASITQTLMHSLFSFLRCSALFFSNLTDIKPTLVITSSTGNLEQEFTELIEFMGLNFSNLASLFDISSTKNKKLYETWLGTIPEQYFQKSVRIVDYPFVADRFFKLPEDFVDLMSMSLSAQSGTSPRASALIDAAHESSSILCLSCGQMLNNQSTRSKDMFSSRRTGACAAHTYRCGTSACVFLRVADCQVMYVQLSMNSSDDVQLRGSFLPAPYIDQYGETDMGLRRGNPLKLSKLRYEQLYKSWLSHSIPEEICRMYQNQNNLAAINWIDL